MKTLVLLIASIFLTFFFAPAVFAQNSQDQTSLVQKISEDLTVLNNWVSLAENAEKTEGADQSFYHEISTLISHLNDSQDFYAGLLSDTSLDEATRLEVENIISAERLISTSLSDLKIAIDNSNDAGIDPALNNYQLGIEKFNTAIENLPTYEGGFGNEYSLIMLISSIASGIISITLFVLSRNQAVLPSDQLKKDMWLALFKSSLWPSIGSIASFVWYELTPPGGTFYVLWGPVLFGYFYFIKGIFIYITQLRPQIVLMKNEELAKLKTTI